MAETTKNRKLFTLLMLLLNIAVLAVAAVGVEVYLSRFSTAPQQYWGWRDIANRPAEQNQLGYRGQPIAYAESDFIVLLVGDSQVQADACGFELMPERRLQDHLQKIADRPVRVFSIGASGYGQDQQLLALEEYFQSYRADLVVVWETTGNDVWNNMFPTHWPKDGWPKPTFWIDSDGILQGPNAKWGAPLRGRFRIVGNLRRWLNPSLDESWERDRLPAPYQPRVDRPPAIETREIELDPFENFFNEKTHYGLYFTPASERTRYGLTLTNRLLLRMQAVAEKNGARFAAFFPKPPGRFPDGFVPISNAAGQTVYFQFSQAQYRQNIQDMNRGLAFFAVPLTTAHPRVSDTDKHLNYVGVDQVMHDLALALEPELADILAPQAQTPHMDSATAGDENLLLDDINLITLKHADTFGFRDLEGPYRQWAMPLQVRWMTTSRAEIECYHTGKTGVRRLLYVKARTAVVPQSLRIEAGGKLVLSETFSAAGQWHTWTTETFEVRPGGNRLNLEAQNSSRSEPAGQPLFILFEEIRLRRPGKGKPEQTERNDGQVD